MNKCIFICLCVSLIFAQCKSKRPKNIPAEKTGKALVSLRIQEFGTWEPLGPFGAPEPMAENGEITPHGAGRFICVNLHPKNDGEILIGHATSGLFKTTDNGKTWIQKLRFPFATGIYQIIRFNSDENHLIACTALDIGNSRQYGYGLIESFDNGETWIRNSLQFEPEEYNLQQSRDIAIIDKKKEKKLLSISDRRIFFSADGAKTWNKVHEAGFTLKSIVVNPHDENSIFVCGNGVLYSRDGGQNWEDITNDICKHFGKVKSEYSSYMATFSQKSRNRFYVAAQDGSVYILESSTDSLRKYRIKNLNAGQLNVPRLKFATHYDEASRIETLYLGTMRLYKSKDNGMNFIQVTHPVKGQANNAHDDITGITFYKDKVYLATDGGVDVSGDEGQTWVSLTNQSVNLNTCMVFGFDKSAKGYMMCGTQDNGIFTLKRGAWYCTKLYGDGGRVAALNDSTGFATGFAMMNYTTRDAGSTFEYKHAGTETGHDFRMSYHSESRTFYLANLHLYKKAEGKYFEILTSRLDASRKIKAFWVNPDNANEIWLCKDDATWGGELKNKLFHTTDGGQTWLDYTNRLPILSWRSITDIFINQDGQIAITLEAFDKKNSGLHKVYFSDDGGQTFVNQSDGLPNVPTNTIVCAKNQWICGNNNGVFVLKAGKWEPFGDEFPATIVTELKYFEHEGVLYASTFGRGIWGIRL